MVFRVHPPRSIFTTSLFSTTFAVAFFVVALPHAIPCPSTRSNALIADDGTSDGQSVVKRRRRHCPVPRPAVGLLKELGLGPEPASSEKSPKVEIVRNERTLSKSRPTMPGAEAIPASSALVTDSLESTSAFRSKNDSEENVRVIFLDRHPEMKTGNRGGS